jgi:Domain of unknown function (DUF222)
MDGAHARSCRAQRELLTFVAEAERRELWWTEGARDMAHLLSMRYGISYWKAERWVQAARALRELPKLADAFATGSLGIDKVVELTRFATPETEASLIPWAERVPSGRIREEGDLAAKRAREETEMIERDRRLDWWFHDEGPAVLAGGRSAGGGGRGGGPRHRTRGGDPPGVAGGSRVGRGAPGGRARRAGDGPRGRHAWGRHGPGWHWRGRLWRDRTADGRGARSDRVRCPVRKRPACEWTSLWIRHRRRRGGAARNARPARVPSAGAGRRRQHRRRRRTARPRLA